MKNFSLKKQLLHLSGALIIPLSPSSQWHQYTFKNIPKNQVKHTQSKITLNVNQSASPLIYAFKKPREVRGLDVRAQLLSPLPSLPKGKAQGQPETDDFILRVGLILKGKSKLNWMQRQMAPKWLVDMEKLIPKPFGIDRVEFFTTCIDKNRVENRKAHHLNEKLQETCLTHLNETGNFRITKNFNKPFEVLGLWIASDGDQLKNKFSVEIEKIQLEIED